MDNIRTGWICGLIGVAIFSGSLPATRVAVGTFDPLFLTALRATLAAVPAAALLLLLRQTRPERTDIPSLLTVALGVVVGFPLLTALALRHVSSAHSIIFIALLPLATALFGVLRAGERPRPAFWLPAVTGSVLVAGFALFTDPAASWAGDLLMCAAVIICGLGYAEGGKLSRKLGGWQVICWALALSLPVTLPAALLLRPDSFTGTGAPAWTSLAYVSLFSMLIGFVFWYRGLALGGIARVSQLQLLQPFMGLILAASLLGEDVSWPMAAVSLAVVTCVAAARKLA